MRKRPSLLTSNQGLPPPGRRTNFGRIQAQWIYVQSFPTAGVKWQVSTNGGERSVWSRDGKELYFVSPDGKMMAAEVQERLEIRGRCECGHTFQGSLAR